MFGVRENVANGSDGKNDRPKARHAKIAMSRLGVGEDRMAKTLLVTAGALVGLITGGIAIYKWLTVERREIKAAAADIQVIGVRAESGYLPVANDDVTSIKLKIQNLGKRDAIEIKAILFHQPGNLNIASDTEDIEAKGLPTVLSSAQSLEIEFLSRGSYQAVAKNFRFSNDPKIAALQRLRGAPYQYRGSISWRDRVSNDIATSTWCFEGNERSLTNIVQESREKNRRKDEGYQSEFTSVPFELKPCALQK